MGKCADISKKANIKPFINKLCSAKTAKNLVGKCMDESNPEHCKTGRYHDGNCKGPSHVRCCIIHASDNDDDDVPQRKASSKIKAKDVEMALDDIEDDEDMLFRATSRRRLLSLGFQYLRKQARSSRRSRQKKGFM